MAFQTLRHMLRPGATWRDVDEYAKALQWPMTDSTPRDRDAGIDGHVVWEADGNILWGQVLENTALHYVVDAHSGANYYAFTGTDADMIGALDAAAAEVLNPWTQDELYAEFDEAPDMKTRGQMMLRLGFGAGPEHHEGTFTRIAAALKDEEAPIRYLAVWAAAHTGYREFIPGITDLADNDPEDWIRDRAASILEAFETVRSG